MGKKVAGAKNVYELAQERLKVIFSEFDNIYVSFSGGKDSGLLLNLVLDNAKKNNNKKKEGKEKTQKEVADMLGISQSYISRLEKKIIKRLKREMIKMGCV